MNRLRVLVYMLCFFFLISAHPIDRGVFVIQVDGLRNSDGVVTLALYEKDGHLSEDKVKVSVKGPIKNNKAILKTQGLPYGEYSLVVIHDENNNGKMDFNIFKMPKEGLGFSNNPRIGISKPSFEETKVKLKEQEKKLNISMKYF